MTLPSGPLAGVRPSALLDLAEAFERAGSLLSEGHQAVAEAEFLAALRSAQRLAPANESGERSQSWKAVTLALATLEALLASLPNYKRESLRAVLGGLDGSHLRGLSTYERLQVVERLAKLLDLRP